jgi:hypothetical protein
MNHFIVFSTHIQLLLKSKYSFFALDELASRFSLLCFPDLSLFYRKKVFFRTNEIRHTKDGACNVEIPLCTSHGVIVL